MGGAITKQNKKNSLSTGKFLGNKFWFSLPTTLPFYRKNSSAWVQPAVTSVSNISIHTHRFTWGASPMYQEDSLDEMNQRGRNK